MVDRVAQMMAVQKEGLELFKKKNADYSDAFAKYGPVGVIMRMEDKLHRYLSISKSGINLVSNEGLEDTLIDLHNYAAMALMLLREKDTTNANVTTTNNSQFLNDYEYEMLGLERKTPEKIVFTSQ
jgi:hypothetical protein